MWSAVRLFDRCKAIARVKIRYGPTNPSRSYYFTGYRILFEKSGNFTAFLPQRAVKLNLLSSSSPRVTGLLRNLSDSSEGKDVNPPVKPSLYQRFKSMYKDYWYVLIPVHVVTSCMWFGSFYYAAQSGFDIAGALEFLNLSEDIMDKIRHGANSTAGYVTISYLLYKISTPLRYTVTLGGTTYTIKYLTARGLLKKMPKKEELKKMMVEQKVSLKDKKDNLKKGIVGKFSSTQKSK